MHRKFWLLIPLLLTQLRAQEQREQEKLLQEVLHRLDNLEQQNRELLEQVKELKQQSQTRGEGASAEGSKPSEPPVEERVKVNEERLAEQAQTKVESSQKFPVWLYGTLLFNAFANSNDASSALGEYGLLSGPGRSGATVRQTILGLEFEGPALPGAGRVEGDLAMDFWAGSPAPSANWLRIRRAGISLKWADSTVFVGQDKPLISPYEPNSLAEVGVPALAGSGNLWFWLPQARFEQNVLVGSSDGIDAQLAILQVGSYLDPPSSLESPSSSPAVYSGGVRPALEGRIALWHRNGGNKTFEVAPGFHISSNHVDGADIPSRIGSVDWLYNPLAKLGLKGSAYYGENVAGLGSLGNSFYMTEAGIVRPVLSVGGWSQISLPLSNRITLNVFGGLEDDQTGNVYGSGIARAVSFAGNTMFHLSTNVVVSLEAQRLWTRTFAGQPNNYNHYDLALAYLF